MTVWLRIGLIFFSTLLTVISAEAALRSSRLRYYLSAYDPTPFHYKADAESGHDIDERGPRFVHRVAQDGLSYELWSNELGCFDEPYHQESDYVLLVGDSFTEYLAPFEDMWGTRVERLLSYRVLKCGVGGYGTRQELIKARRIIQRVGISPRLIVLGYYMNDLDDDYRFPAMTVVNGHLVMRQAFDLSTGHLNTETSEHLEEMVEKWERFCEMPGVPAERFALVRRFLRRHSILFGAARSLRPEPARSTLPTPESSYATAFQSPEKYPWLRAAWTAHLANLKALQQLAYRSAVSWSSS